MRRPVTIVGVGDDGRSGLSPRSAEAVAGARVLAGGERHLAFFPEFAGERVVLGRDLAGSLAALHPRAGDGALCVLASGDPLFFGVGARAIEAFGADRVEILPQPSSMQWAFARIGVPWDDVHEEAEHLEHAMSPRFEAYVRASVGDVLDGVGRARSAAEHSAE